MNWFTKITAQLRMLYGSLLLHLTASRLCDLAGVARAAGCPAECPGYRTCSLRVFGIRYRVGR